MHDDSPGPTEASGATTAVAKPVQPEPPEPPTALADTAHPGVVAHTEGPAAHEDLPAGTRIGRYVLLARLGAGGMGVVYGAYDPELDRQIALKLLPPHALGSPARRARLLREAQAMARLAHPHVLAVHDAGAHEGQLFIAMELVLGGTIATWLQAKPRTRREILRAFIGAGRGLAAAHRAGLVHRDFKPDNVLVGADGRARVADFGLARAVVSSAGGEDDGVQSPARSSVLHSNLTVQGARVGTPAYMAPEQHAGRDVDARGDQYSFCVALWEALLGERPKPVAPRTTTTTASRNRRLPRWLRRVLIRGLADGPEARYPSMDALLDDLERIPRRRRIAALSVAALGAVAAASVAYSIASDSARTLCTGGAAQLAGIWDDAIRAGGRRAFLATGRPDAPEAWRRVEAHFDEQARNWTAMYNDACAATHVRGEQSEELLDLRMECLRQRREEMRVLGEIVQGPKAAALVRRGGVPDVLEELRVCANVTALRSRILLPKDPATRRAAERIRSHIGAAIGMRSTGRFAEALELLERVVGLARAVGYGPVLAEALYELGQLRQRNGAPEQGRRELEEAVWAAEASHHDLVSANASASLVHVTGYQLGEPESGLLWSRHAAAAIARLGGGLRMEARLASNQGAVLLRQGKITLALAALERGVQGRLKAYGPDHFNVALAHVQLAEGQREAGKLDDAERTARASLAVFERKLSLRHPMVARVLTELGRIAFERGAYDEAARDYASADKILIDSVGPKSARRRDLLADLGDLALARGDTRSAKGYFEQALRIAERELGSNHPRLAREIEGLGEVQLAQGQAVLAVQTFRRALAMRRARPGPAAAEARTLFALARAMAVEGREVARARRHAREARAVLAAAGPAQAKRLAEVDRWLDRHGR